MACACRCWRVVSMPMFFTAGHRSIVHWVHNDSWIETTVGCRSSWVERKEPRVREICGDLRHRGEPWCHRLQEALGSSAIRIQMCMASQAACLVDWSWDWMRWNPEARLFATGHVPACNFKDLTLSPTIPSQIHTTMLQCNANCVDVFCHWPRAALDGKLLEVVQSNLHRWQHGDCRRRLHGMAMIWAMLHPYV